MFKSKFPIICAAMNKVSDLNLARACVAAGIVPSLIAKSYLTEDQFRSDALEIIKSGSDLQVSYIMEDMVDDADLILELGISHIEIVGFIGQSRQAWVEATRARSDVINAMRSRGVKIVLKIGRTDFLPGIVDLLDAISYKGSAAAGRSVSGVDLLTEIPVLKKQYPDLAIIAQGGVKNKQDIADLLNAGACAVSIGTLFAMAAESSVPLATKNRLLQASNSDIRRLPTGAKQRAIVFDEVASDDFNNTKGLQIGLNTGTSGHIFVGNAIGSITQILPVEHIVNNLTQ
jgi:NAD(P)H-dependent flavin oxidoreductase YrpB (nitropropane dioxygenase family)